MSQVVFYIYNMIWLPIPNKLNWNFKINTKQYVELVTNQLRKFDKLSSEQ